MHAPPVLLACYYCKPASRDSIAAQLVTPVSADRVHCVGVCALPRPSRSCHAAELPIVLTCALYTYLVRR